MTTQPVTLVILGAAGDLTTRLLLPGLGTLLATQPDRQVTVVGVGRRPMPEDDWTELVDTALADGDAPAEIRKTVAETTRFEVADVTDAAELRDLLDTIDGPTVLFFALSPSVTARACEALATLDLADDVRLALEKPFGKDLESARDLNALLATFRHENQIFRVDHFMGEAAVLNLLGFRFANRLFEPVWNANHVERIEVVWDETLALEGRAGYYDTAGALVDMLQSHLLLVMALTAMEEVSRVDHREMRDLMAHCLRATRIYGGDPVAASRRARYTAGHITGGPEGDRNVPAYLDEEGVDAANDTETLAELTLEINNARWSGVPIVLRSGKALAADRSHVRVQFRPVAHIPDELGGPAVPNTVTLGLAETTMELCVMTNGGGDKFKLDPTVLYTDLRPSPVLPYGEVLARIFDGDPLLSTRGDIAEECWRIVAPVLAAWRAGEVPMDEYPAGIAGPDTWER